MHWGDMKTVSGSVVKEGLKEGGGNKRSTCQRGGEQGGGVAKRRRPLDGKSTRAECDMKGHNSYEKSQYPSLKRQKTKRARRRNGGGADEEVSERPSIFLRSESLRGTRCSKN